MKRLNVKFKHYLADRVTLSSVQVKGIKIFKNILSRSDIELLISPTSDERYLKFRDIFMILSSNRLRIINHTYSYDIDIHDETYKSLRRVFDRRTEQERYKMEREINKNINSSLSVLSKDLGIKD